MTFHAADLILALSLAALLLWTWILVVGRHRARSADLAVAIRAAVAATLLAYLAATALTALAYALHWNGDTRDLLSAAARVVPLVGGLYTVALMHVKE